MFSFGGNKLNLEHDRSRSRWKVISFMVWKTSAVLTTSESSQRFNARLVALSRIS